jgi:hypothetical protein
VNQLARAQYEELEEQMSRMNEDIPGEHLKLIALLNRLGFNPMSKQEATDLAQELLNEGEAE